MTKKALVVEDDPEVMEHIEDTLCSLEHEHTWVTNQQDARQQIRSNRFDYALLDLQIPAKPNRGGANKEFGMNLLREMATDKRRLPVIIMTAYHADGLNLTSKLSELGASEFIAKPFGTGGRSLAKVILKVLKAESSRAATSRAKLPCNQQQPFSGGELEFFPTHAELLGVKIITARGQGRSLPVLRTLASKDSQGRFVRMSGEELADAIGSIGGVNAVTAAIQTLRRNITERLRKVGIACGTEDVIAHDEQGYYLHDWITFRGQASIAEGIVMNCRQQWVLEELGRGKQVSRLLLQQQWNIGEKTAKRDLAELGREGLITVRRQGRQVSYELPPSE